MLLSIARNERAAIQFDDVASALDSGLPVTTIGGDAAAGDRVVHGILARRGVQLSPTEDEVLLHAWRAGKVGNALRQRADSRRRQAEFVRTMWSGLRYPVLLLLMVLVASVATMSIAGKGMLIGVLITYAAVGVALWSVRSALRSGAPWLQRVPLVSRLIAGFAELPYLETLQALYGAGVPLKEAHRSAVATVPVRTVRERLQVAHAVGDSGRPLRDALEQAHVLHGETRHLLSTGEQTGQLEEALGRALVRRQDVTGRDFAAAARLLGQIAYGIAVVAVVLIVFAFYSKYLAAFGGR